MKKNILLVASVFTLCAYGMETNFWTITYGRARINLNKGLMSYVGDKVDAIVVGINQQLDGHYANVGELFKKRSFVFEEDRETHGTSDYNVYQPHSYPDDLKRCNIVVKKEVDCCVFQMTEPCIRQKDGIFTYAVDRPLDPWVRNNWQCCLFKGDEAIEEAGHDLACCYIIAFNEVLKKIPHKAGERKSIAFATLSADVGFPREKAASIAVNTILECIQNHPDDYDHIELVVEKSFEFDWYKLLLMEKCGVIEKICLLYWANKDSEHWISLLPREIIHYIAKLL